MVQRIHLQVEAYLGAVIKINQNQMTSQKLAGFLEANHLSNRLLLHLLEEIYSDQQLQSQQKKSQKFLEEIIEIQNNLVVDFSLDLQLR